MMTTTRQRVAVTDFDDQRAEVNARRDEALLSDDLRTADQCDSELADILKAEQRAQEAAELRRLQRVAKDEQVRQAAQQAERDAEAALRAELATLCHSEDHAWETTRQMDWTKLGRIVQIVDRLNLGQGRGRLGAQRMQEWAVLRSGEVLGEIGVPLSVQHWQKRLTLAQMFAGEPVPTAPSREAR